MNNKLKICNIEIGGIRYFNNCHFYEFKSEKDKFKHLEYLINGKKIKNKSHNEHIHIYLEKHFLNNILKRKTLSVTCIETGKEVTATSYNYEHRYYEG